MIYEARIIRGSSYQWETIGDKGVLVDCGGPETEHVSYDPLNDEKELYLELAGLKTSERNILAFANKYGDFGQYQDEQNNAAKKFTKRGGPMYWDLKSIRGEIRSLRKAVNGWKEVAGKLEDFEIDQIQYNKWAPITISKVKMYVTPLILRNPVRFVWHARGSIPAAWLQLIMAVGDQRPVKQCDICPTLFEVKQKRNHERRFCSNACKTKFHRESKR